MNDKCIQNCSEQVEQLSRNLIGLLLSTFEVWLPCVSVNTLTVLIPVSKIQHEMTMLPRGKGLEIAQEFESLLL